MSISFRHSRENLIDWNMEFAVCLNSDSGSRIKF